MWVTNNYLEWGLWLMGALGFTYKTNIVWVKVKMEDGPIRRVFGDIHLIAPMLEYLGQTLRPPRLVNGKEEPGSGFRYRCKMFDRKTRLCTIYEIRPQMCRDYPGPRGCNFAACTWESRKAKKWPKQSKKFKDVELKESVELLQKPETLG